MTSGPPDPAGSAGGRPEPSEETLRRLEERLDRASEVAERLIVEAAARVARAPEGDPPSSEGAAAEEPPLSQSEPRSEPGPEEPPLSQSEPRSEPGPEEPPLSQSEPRSEPGPEAPRAAPKPPPAGWQRRTEGRSDGSGAAAGPASVRSEFDILLQILGAVRDRIPPELQQRLAEALREVLMAVRAVIDWYLERTERRRAESVEVEDIPII